MAETADILESVPYFLKLGAKKIWLDYDEEADVLHVSFRRPQQATDSRMDDDLIYTLPGQRTCWTNCSSRK